MIVILYIKCLQLFVVVIIITPSKAKPEQSGDAKLEGLI